MSTAPSEKSIPVAPGQPENSTTAGHSGGAGHTPGPIATSPRLLAICEKIMSGEYRASRGVHSNLMVSVEDEDELINAVAEARGE